MKTQTIAGHSISLEEGTRYIASRPILEMGRIVYPINIRTLTGVLPVVTIEDLDIDAANAFLDEFNNGKSSFDGRVW